MNSVDVKWIIFVFTALVLCRCLWLEYLRLSQVSLSKKLLVAMQHNALVAESAKIENGFLRESFEEQREFCGCGGVCTDGCNLYDLDVWLGLKWDAYEKANKLME